jgi:zinc/manganese transport system substrate-binding protein
MPHRSASSPGRRRAGRAGLTALLVCILAALSGCATTAPGRSQPESTVLVAAASINAWGSILGQLGGDRVRAVSIISNPNTDPHDYEPSPRDANLIERCRVFVENGVGYDSWAAKALAASPSPGRRVIDVGTLTGTPSDGNPHRWYSPADVERVADAVTAALTAADPAGAAYYAARRADFETAGLGQYHRLIAEIRARYAGVPVGASESIFAPLAAALGLQLLTPPGFLRAVSEGTDPSSADKATIDAQLRDHKIEVYVFNSQNATPDVAQQVAAAGRSAIPVTSVTETLTPVGASFQQWQVSQLLALQAALGRATGR